MQLKKEYIILFFLCLIFSSSFSQPYQACFSAVKTRGCVPFTVNLIDCSGTEESGLPAPFYEYRTGASLTTDTFHTYTTPGFYTVTQSVDNGIGGVDTIKNYIEVLPSPLPLFTVGLCQNNQAVVTIRENNYEEYFIDFGFGPADTIAVHEASSYTYLDTSPRTITVTGNYNPGGCGASASETIVPFTTLIKPDLLDLTQDAGGTLGLRFNAFTHQKYIIEVNNGSGYTPYDTLTDFPGGTYDTGISGESGNTCFRIRTEDACGNFLLSEEICSISLTVSAENRRNLIGWNTDPTAFSSFRVFRNDIIIGTSSGSSFIDSAVICGKNYCYYIQGVLATSSSSGEDVISNSAEKCVTAISSVTPAAPEVQTLTFTGTILNLSWIKPEGAVLEYSIYEISGTSNTEIAKTTNTSYQFSNIKNETCYSLSYIDSCGNQSPKTGLLCPSFLTVSSGDSYNELTWSPFSGPFSPTGYFVEVYQNGTLTETVDAGLSTSSSLPVDPENGTVVYKIRIEGNSGAISYSNPVQLKYEIKIFAPTIFTPNNDGDNDLFLPKGKFIDSYTLIILNRWGEYIFTTHDPTEGWNGTFQGRPAPEGAYGYLIEASDKNGKVRTISGTVTLIR